MRIRKMISAVGFLSFLMASALPASAQSPDKLQSFFRQDIGLSDDQIASIRRGQSVAKAMPSRMADEVFLFGAVYIHASPESYVKFANDFDRLRQLPNYLALGVFSTPPQLSDLKGFAFTDEEIQALKSCKAGHCSLQMPAGDIEEFQKSIDWSAADANEKMNQRLQKIALERLSTYQREGNQALGVYNDKHDPTEVAQQFAYMLSYAKALPEQLPEFYHYLLEYPKAKPANVEDTFYWTRVKFGLKPTLRIVQVSTLRGKPAEPVAYAIAEKQLYSSHYFETALDLSFCVRDTADARQSGFYLIMVMGSEQTGLTGIKGSIVRKAAVGRSVSNLQKALESMRATLESGQPVRTAD